MFYNAAGGAAYRNPYLGSGVANPGYAAPPPKLPYGLTAAAQPPRATLTIPPSAAGFAPGAAGTSASGPPTWNPESDPLIAQVRSQSNQSIAQAKANLLRLQKQDLIGFGSQSLAKSILGNDPVVKSISGNPDQSFSFLANLKRQYGSPVGQKQNWFGAARIGLIPQMEEAANQDNLWFSSSHLDQLHALEQDKLAAQDTEQRRIQANLGQYQQNYTDAVTAAKNAIIQAILQRQNALGIA